MALTVEEVEAVLRLKDDLSGQLNTAQNNLKSFGAAATRIGAGLTAAITLPLLGVGAAAIKMGMSAIESENLFEVSFGGMADSAREWSTELSDRLGLNDFELRRTSATLFTMFDAMKIGEKSSFDMATSISELSADMASFFNLNPAEAFEKLRSGLVGQTEPLRALGIIVDETTVKQTAMRLGLIKQGDEMSVQQKVLARYLAIMDQTKKMQGDIAKTIESPTNQLRIMKEQMTKLTIELGMALMPAFTSLLGVLKGVIPYIESVVNWFKNLSPAGQKTIIVIAAFAASLGPLLLAFGMIAASITAVTAVLPLLGIAFAALTGPIGLTIGALVGLGAAWLKWGDDIKRIVASVYGTVKGWLIDRFPTITQSVGDKINAVKGYFKGLYTSVVGSSSSTMPAMVEGVKAGFDQIHLAAEKLPDTLLNVKSEFAGLADTSKEAAEKAKELAEAHKKLVKTMSGKEAIKQAELHMAALKDTAGLTTLTKEAQDVLNSTLQKAMDAYRALGVTAPAEMRKVWAATLQLPKEQQLTLRAAVELLPTTFGKNAFGREIEAVFGAEPLPARVFEGMFAKMPEGVKTVVKNAKISDAIIGSMSALPNMLIQSFTGGGGVGGAIKAIGTDMGVRLFGEKGALAGAMGAAKKGLSSIFGNAVGGAFAAAIPAVGALIGPGLEALWGGIKKLFGGPSKEELDARKFQNEFVTLLEKTATAAQKAEMAVAAGSMTYKTLAVVGRDAMLAIGATAAQADTVVKGLLDTHHPEKFKAAMAQVKAALDLQGEAQKTLTEVLGRYKFSIEELGPALARQELDKKAQQLFKDWEILTKSGINITAVTREMAGTMNEYLKTARHTGIEIPSAMKPMIEEMIRMGTLTDDSGEKILDLKGSGITFSSTMTEGFKSVVESVKTLTDILRRGLGLAIDETTGKLNAIPKSIDVDINVNEHRNIWGFTSPDLSGIPSLAHGTSGFIDFGRGTLAMLHGEEAVVPKGRTGGMGLADLKAEFASLRWEIKKLPQAFYYAARDGKAHA